METIKISEVIIPKAFIKSIPKSWKIEKVKCYIDEHRTLDKPIVINSKGILIDNYIRYLVAKQYGIEDIPYITQDNKGDGSSVTYIIGMFKNCQKRYIWKNIKKIPVKVGDIVLVDSCTKKGRRKVVVEVVGIIHSTDATMLEHKPMIKNLSLKRKNNGRKQ